MSDFKLFGITLLRMASCSFFASPIALFRMGACTPSPGDNKNLKSSQFINQYGTFT